MKKPKKYKSGMYDVAQWIMIEKTILILQRLQGENSKVMV